MRKLLLGFSVCVGIACLTAIKGLGQGWIYWQNIGNNWLVTVATTGVLNPNTPGAFVGDDYTVCLYFANGPDQPESSLVIAPNFKWQFWGKTGLAPEHGPEVDGAGLFGPEITWLAASSSVVTIQARVWYNPGGNTYPDYETAAAAGVNVGKSILVNHTLATGIQLPTEPNFLPFTVQVIPEPGVYVLGGLALAGLWIFRRRN